MLAAVERLIPTGFKSLVGFCCLKLEKGYESRLWYFQNATYNPVNPLEVRGSLHDSLQSAMLQV
jgi:hypothetical protein